MNYIVPATFGFAGAVLGFLIPQIAQSIARYKYARKNRELVTDGRYMSVFLKLALSLLNGLAWGFAGSGMEDRAAALLLSVLFSAAIVTAIIDLRIRIVPNELVLLMLITSIAFQTAVSGVSALPGALLCMAAMMILFTVAAGLVGFGKVGAGDIKLAGAMGMALGYPDIITGVLAMSAALLIYCLTGLILRKLTLQSMFPFAPFMMLGMMVALICGILR